MSGIGEPSKSCPCMVRTLVGLGQIEARVLEPGRIEHALFERVRVRFAAGIGQGLRQQIETEIRVEQAGPGANNRASGVSELT